MSLRGAKKIPSLCSEQAVRSHTVNVIARSVATRQSRKKMLRLPRPFRGRNDIVKYILLIYESRQKARPDPINVLFILAWIAFVWVKAKSKTWPRNQNEKSLPGRYIPDILSNALSGDIPNPVFFCLPALPFCLLGGQHSFYGIWSKRVFFNPFQILQLGRPGYLFILQLFYLFSDHSSELSYLQLCSLRLHKYFMGQKPDIFYLSVLFPSLCSVFFRRSDNIFCYFQSSKACEQDLFFRPFRCWNRYSDSPFRLPSQGR